MKLFFIDILFIAFGIFMVIYSYKRGLLKRFKSLISTVLSAIICYFVYGYLNRFHFENSLYKILILFIVFLILYIIIRIIINMISTDISHSFIGKGDKILGLFVGLIEYCVLMIAVSFLINIFSKQTATHSYIIQFIVQLF